MKYIITVYIDYKERDKMKTQKSCSTSAPASTHTKWHSEEPCFFHVFLQSLSLIIGSRLGSRHHSSELGLVSLGQRHLEPVLHVHGERQLGRDGVALDDVDAVAV